MLPTSHPSYALVVIAALALTACGGGGSTPITVTPPPPLALPLGIDAGGQGAASDPLTRFGTVGRFDLVSNLDLQTMAITLGDFSTAIGSNPSAAFQRTSTGFDIEFSSGNKLQYDTRIGSRHITAANGYRNCTNNCVGSGLGLTPIETTFVSGSTTLNYAVYGEWATRPLVGFTGFAMFATGTPSLAAQVPTTGSATYNGTAIGAAYSNRTSTDGPQRFTGDISLTANFAGRTISGAVTNIRSAAVYSGVQNTFGNIAFANGTFSGSSFSGTTTGSASPTNNPEQLAGSTGVFGGRFYGPAAEEIAGTFNLKNANTNLIGSFGAKR